MWKACAELEEEKKCVFRDISKHDIDNAFALPNMPLSDLIHGIYKISPLELLHTSGSGLIKYIFAPMRARLAPESRRSYSGLHVKSALMFQNKAKLTFPGELIARVLSMG